MVDKLNGVKCQALLDAADGNSYISSVVNRRLVPESNSKGVQENRHDDAYYDKED